MFVKALLCTVMNRTADSLGKTGKQLEQKSLSVMKGGIENAKWVPKAGVTEGRIDTL